jgi:hypothetical protein
MVMPKPRNLVPAGILVAVLLSMAVAWAFRDQRSRERGCAALYATAVTAADTARVDSTVVPTGWTGPTVTCGQLRTRE